MSNSSQVPIKVEDLLGAGRAVEKAIEAGEAFLRALFGPAVNEVGELFADRIREYRARRAKLVAARAAEKLREAEIEPNAVPLRVSIPLIDSASLEDDAELGEKWASLLAHAAASATHDSTLVSTFVEILKQLSPIEARILDWMLDFYEGHRDPLSAGPMVDAATEYESNSFELSEFTEFTNSLVTCQLIFQNLLRLGICEDQLDRNSFTASLAGQLVLATRPRRADGFTHEVIKFSAFGLAFVRACRFPGHRKGQSQVSLHSKPSIEEEFRRPDDSIEEGLFRKNPAVERLVSLGVPLDAIRQVLGSANTVDEFKKKILVAGERGYGKLALNAFEHDPKMLDELNDARAIISKPPLLVGV